MKKTILLLGICFFAIASKAQTKLSDFNFLLGHWEMKTEKGKTSEHWRKSPDSLNGKSYRHAANGDSVLLESVTIKKIKGNFYFCVTGAGNADLVMFKLVSTANKTFVFENKQHDFPQRIYYQPKNKNSLFAWIEGEINGKKEKSEFPYQRQVSN